METVLPVAFTPYFRPDDERIALAGGGGGGGETFNIVDASGDNIVDASGNFIVWSE